VTRAAVIGATSWGTTLAMLLARGGCDTSLVVRNVPEADKINAARENTARMPSLRLPDNLIATADLESLATSELVVVAVPSATLRQNLVRHAPAISPDATIVSATKGLEPDTCLRMSQVIESFGVESERILALSGPNFASEIVAELPAATVIAGLDQSRAHRAQQLLNSTHFRVYTSDDPIGVELAGALKNILAIVCGLSDGLGYGDNARAALITRGLAEITRLGVAAGAQPLTFQGLAGIGDLVLTCQSDPSRNRRLGQALARGLDLDKAVGSIGLVEGIVTARAVPLLAQRLEVEMPICSSLHSVLFQGKSAADAGRDLMTRAARPERDQ
jgi:glycerol-3-phosphate dehydrogenase (NAD(P)+)